MATFSLGGGVTPGAPGVYINESAGVSAVADIASFSTVYMLVEAPEETSVTVFPFNSPVPITSLSDYKVLVGGSVPTGRIPLLSYNCVDEFFQNAQIGDLRVVRVGTPNQIVEIEILPSGTKLNSTSLPSQLEAGDTVYVQLILNGNRLVAGDGSTGYTSSGEWLGVPVTIPVNYIAGDEVNNRKISAAIATAVAAAIESNPSIRSSVYVREFGMVNDLDPTSNSQNSFVTIAAATFDGSVTVITEQLPVGANYVLMQNAYDVQNIVGQQGNLVRVYQDYIQCIETAFDGQQDQGYLITPTAYAQFNTVGRTQVGAAAAAHCASNNFKWLALADPGPFLITDVNQYSQFTPHQAADDLITDGKYLVDNAIYKWVGTDVNYPRMTYQAIVSGSSAAEAIRESVNSVADGEKTGIQDLAVYTAAVNDGPLGKVILNPSNYWPVSYQIQEVDLSDASGTGNAFEDYNGTSVFVVAPPASIADFGDYSVNIVYLTETASEAAAVLNEVTLAGGSSYMGTLPTGAISFTSTTGTASLTYTTPVWNFPQTINGQTSNLVQNTSGATVGVNTLHLPSTLQDPTDTYNLSFKSRTIFNPSTSIAGSSYAGQSNVLVIEAINHQLVSGQKLYFTQNITKNGATLLAATTKAIAVPYYVTAIDADYFTLSESLSAYTAGTYITVPSSGSFSTNPSIFYTSVLGGQQTSASLSELSVIPFIRARKYGLNSGTIYDEALNVTSNPVTSLPGLSPGVSIYLNNSSTTLGTAQISPFGETTTAGWLPGLTLIPVGGGSTTLTENFYCTPTVDQSFAAQAYLVPTIEAIPGGSYAAGVDATSGTLGMASPYVTACGLTSGASGNTVQAAVGKLVGVWFNVTSDGVAPDGTTSVVNGDRIAVTYNGVAYTWLVIPASTGVDGLIAAGQPLYGSQVEIVFTGEQTPPTNLWRFDTITSTEIISDALRGVGTSGVPQAVFIEAGVDSVNRLSNDSQNYFDPFGFIAYYGPYVGNSASQWIPPSPYVTGVAVRRYRAEGYQFPPAGVKYQLADAMAVQIAINSSQQNLLNPEGCNAIRTLPNYPSSAVFIWGGRTRVNTADAQQRLYQFVNTRVILNVAYGSLRGAFDNQIFNVIDGFGVAFNQIISVGNSVLNQLYSRGALYGARPGDAFQVICDNRINTPASLENGIINTKVFVTPVPTLERIQIDLIRVAIGQMQNELSARGLSNNG